METILVTGGAGFIGSNLCEYLLKRGYKVKVLDNLATGNKNNISDFFTNPNFEYVYGDICDLEVLRQVCTNVNMICNLAAIPSVPRSIVNPLQSHKTNVDGFLNVLLVAKEKNIKRIVYASSSSVYGDNKFLPKTENNIGKQLSPYALNKYINELYANLFGNLYGLEVIGARFFNVFGPKQDPSSPYSGVISKFISNELNNKKSIINGKGDYSRDFTYIDNVTSFLHLALTTTNQECYGQVYNVGCGGNISILKLFQLITQILGNNNDPLFSTERAGDVPHSCADISKAKNDLGYEVLKTFDQGILETVEYYKLH